METRRRPGKMVAAWSRVVALQMRRERERGGVWESVCEEDEQGSLAGWVKGEESNAGVSVPAEGWRCREERDSATI